MDRANSRALRPVPLAEEPNEVPSIRYTGFFIGISYVLQIKKTLN
jgi:hypothetical protein